MKRTGLIGLALIVCSVLIAEKTKSWHQTTGAEFEKGIADGIAIRSDGTLTSAPKIEELFEAPASYLGAIAADSKGNIYVAGGPDARVYRIPGDGGDGELFFEADAVDIRALVFDADDNLYAAVSPEAKVYRIAPNGDSEEFYDPGCAYVWTMVFDSQNRLYLGTGDKGEIHRVSPSGDGEVFFETEETHIRSIVIGGDDNLIVGTDPSGLVMRICTGDEGPRGFVLHQSPRAEITSVVLAPDGTIYAAGVGNRPAPPVRRTTAASTTQTQARTTPQRQPSTQGSQQTSRPTTTRTVPAALLSRVVGGSTIYAIATDGEPREVWKSTQAIVYALELDSDGKLLAATGDKGRLIRIDDDTRSAIVATRDSKQVTVLAAAGDRVIAATSNIGTVFALGPNLSVGGEFESDVHDAKLFSTFGRAEWKGEGVSLHVRSGNLQSPERNWSEWSPIGEDGNATTQVPGARFVQWKAVLRAEGDNLPELRSATLHYQPKNSPPRLLAIEATPANHRFPPRTSNARIANITLPPLGTAPTTRRTTTTRKAESMSAAQGFAGVRWKAEDANGDDLEAKLEIRGESGTTWILIEDEIADTHHSWDSTAFADGWYVARITVNDSLSNQPADALSASMVSEPLLIDNSAPEVLNLTALEAEGSLRVSFAAADAASRISKAEYSVNGGDWKLLLPTNGLYDSNEVSFEFETSHPPERGGVVAVRVADVLGNLATAKAAIVAAG